MLAIGYVCRKAAFRAKPLKSGLTAIGHFAVGRQRAPVPVIRSLFAIAQKRTSIQVHADRWEWWQARDVVPSSLMPSRPYCLRIPRTGCSRLGRGLDRAGAYRHPAAPAPWRRHWRAAGFADRSRRCVRHSDAGQDRSVRARRMDC